VWGGRWAPPWRAHRALQRHRRAGQHGGGGAAGGRRPRRAAQAGGHHGLRLRAAELRRRGCSARAAAGSVPRCEARTSAGALVRPDARPTPFAWSDLNMEWQSERVGQSAMGRQRGVLSQMLIRLGRSPRGQHRLPLREQRMQTVCTRPTKRSSVPGPSDVQPEARNQPRWQDTAGARTCACWRAWKLPAPALRRRARHAGRRPRHRRLRSARRLGRPCSRRCPPSAFRAPACTHQAPMLACVMTWGPFVRLSAAPQRQVRLRS